METSPGPKSGAAKRLRLLRRLTEILDVPMAILSLVFFGLIVADLAVPPDATYRPRLDQAALAIWGVFLAEYLVKLAIAPDRLAFLQRRWLDLLVLLIPMVRWLRFVRLFRSGFSLFRLGLAVRRGIGGIGQFLVSSRFTYVLGLTAVVIVTASVAMLILERDGQDAQIRTFGDALWWSAAIVTTVGADVYPRTAGGRLLAIGMMIYGMAVFGYFVSYAVQYLQRGAGKARR